MSPVAIPAWTAEGVLPPIDAAQPVSTERSPYAVSLTDYVLRFGDTPGRRTVLDGLLRYRAALHALGLVSGFQWLDGSFLEHVERIEGRPPERRRHRDILPPSARPFTTRPPGGAARPVRSRWREDDLLR
jgi:hypothetical protein